VLVEKGWVKVKRIGHSASRLFAGHEPIPFEEENDAKKFLKERKGKKILRIMDISLKLIMSLDNP
jgi:nitrous oxide reductase accessory protein NosL